MRTTILALALVLCWAGQATADFEFVFVPHIENPDGWSRGDEIPEAIARQLHVELQGDDGARRLREARCDNLLRTYNDLRSGELSRPAAYIRDLRSGTVRVYLIDDREGLTEVQRAYVGPATYESRIGEAGRVYAWPCANNVPERAIKLGEFHPGEIMNEDGQTWEEWQATLLHELTHTVDQTTWGPMTVLVNTPEGVRRETREAGSREAYGADREHYDIEILPNSRAAFMEGIANFVGFTWSDVLIEDYVYYLQDGMLAVEHDSETRRLIGIEPDETDTFDDTVYDSYRWTRLPFEAMVRNEILIALLLNYYARHLPPQEGRAGGSGFEQVLYHFVQTQRADRTVIDLIGSILESASFSDRVTLSGNRYFVIGAMDLITNFNADRAEMEAVLRQRTFIPEDELTELLNEYFGAGGLAGERQAIRQDAGAMLPDLDAAMAALARRYNLPDNEFF